MLRNLYGIEEKYLFGTVFRCAYAPLYQVLSVCLSVFHVTLSPKSWKTTKFTKNHCSFRKRATNRGAESLSPSITQNTPGAPVGLSWPCLMMRKRPNMKEQGQELANRCIQELPIVAQTCVTKSYQEFPQLITKVLRYAINGQTSIPIPILHYLVR